MVTPQSNDRAMSAATVIAKHPSCNPYPRSHSSGFDRGRSHVPLLHQPDKLAHELTPLARARRGQRLVRTILDVRSEQERGQGYIPGSKLIPIDTIERRLAEIPKNRPVIVYCAVGSRSRVVAQGLSRLGYGEVYNMRDGIMGWYRNGYPVQR